jgi:phage-related protein
MSYPIKLASAPTCVTVDGVDLHYMGMLVSNVRMSPPPAKESSFQIQGRDGDFDFTRTYGSRTMTLSGTIIGNSNSDCLSNIDAVKKYFGLKKNCASIKVIFINQSDRYWTCRFQSMDIGSVGLWWSGHSAAYTLTLKCLKPYAEATSITSEEIFLHCLQNKIIDYAGTIRTPLNIEISPRYYRNIIEYQYPDINEDYTKWSYSNASGSDDTSENVWGDNCIKVTRSSPGAFLCYKSIALGSSYLTQIDITKNYVFAAYAKASTDENIQLKVVTNLASHTATFGATSTGEWNMAFVKLTAAQMVGVTSVELQIQDNGTDSEFYVDGAFIYFITAAEAADDDYFPPPYGGASGFSDWMPPKNPALKLHAGKNIFPIENGNYIAADWTGDTDYCGSFEDPFGGDDRVFLCFDSEGSSAVYTPPFYLTGGKYYKISFDYHLDISEGVSGEANIYLARRLGPGIDIGQNLLAYPSAKTTAWQTVQIEVRPTKATEYAHFKFETVYSRLYIKNIMVIEEAEQGETFESYQKPSISSASYSGTLDGDSHGDTLTINSDRMVADLYDDAELTISNGMANLTMEPLFLEPGINVLRYSDARLGAAIPEAQSCGGVRAKLSYRKRYL